MQKQRHACFGLLGMAILCNGILASTALAQDSAKLRYGCQKGGQYYYRVTLVADLPLEEITDTGVLHYDVPASADGQFTLKCTGRLQSSTKVKGDASSGSSGRTSPGRRADGMGRAGPPLLRGISGRGPSRPGSSRRRSTAKGKSFDKETILRSPSCSAGKRNS